MDTKDKTIKDIERKILDELGEEIRELRRQGKLYKFETAMDHAMEKFKDEIRRRTEQEIEEYNKEVPIKKTVRNAGNQQE